MPNIASTGTNLSDSKTWRAIPITAGNKKMTYGFQSNTPQTDAVNLGQEVGQKATDLLFDDDGKLKSSAFIGIGNRAQYPKPPEVRPRQGVKKAGGLAREEKIGTLISGDKPTHRRAKDKKVHPVMTGNGTGKNIVVGVEANGLTLYYNFKNGGAQGTIPDEVKSAFLAVQTQLSSINDWQSLVRGQSLPKPREFTATVVNGSEINTYTAAVNENATLPTSTDNITWSESQSMRN